MFSKTFFIAALTFAATAQAHFIVVPPLGVSGTPVRADVQTVSASSPCGNTDIASTLDTSTAVAADATGSFTVTGTDFNAGADGSRSVTAQVDATGVGKTFVPVTVTTNGDANPTTVGSDPIVASLPAGTKCSGGAAGNLCLVAFKSTAGFGNCVAVSQGAATAGTTTGAANTTAVTTGAANTTAVATSAANTTVAATGNATTPATGAKAAGKAGKHHKGAAAGAGVATAAVAKTGKATRSGSLRALEARLMERMSEMFA